MSKFFNNLFDQKGSMMVEALAMLGLITMVTPILYKKAAERTTELQDINTANQMRTISKAMDDYIKDHYSSLSTGPDLVKLETDDIEPYLPYGFSFDDSRLLGDYQIALRKDVVGEGDNQRASITGMVVADPKNDLSMMRASKIASMIGANGGVVYQGSDDSKTIQGVGGGWSATEKDYGFTMGSGDDEIGTLSVGGIAVGSVHAILAEGGGASEKDVLYRNNSKGIEYNTMETNLYLGDYDIEDVNNLITTTAQVTGATEGALQVAGGASVGSLLSQGAANILGTLEVGDAADLKSTLKVADKLSVLSNGADIAGNTNISGDLSVTGKGSVSSGLDVTGELVANNESQLKGKVTIGTDGNSNLQMLDVRGNANVSGSLTVGTDFQAPNISGITSLRGGRMGASEENAYNFVARSDQVSIAAGRFSVGVGGNRLLIDDTVTRMQSADGTAGMALSSVNASIASGTDYINLQSGTARVHGTTEAVVESDQGGELTIADGIVGTGTDVDLSAYNGATGGKLKLASDSAKFGFGNDVSYVSADSTGARIVVPNAAQTTAPTIEVTSAGELKLDGVKTLVNTDNLYLDEDKMILADETNDLVSTSVGVVGSKGIIFRREGSIELPRGGTTNRTDLPTTAGYQDVPGYIKLDRILANQKYERVGSGVSGVNDEANTVVRYDAYQLNPAYTSVMHDIKLTTRGGARLSDILPDFINRGIYVLDNTYPESKTNPNWENYTVSSNSGVLKVSPDLGDCSGDADCIATPWLGFVPAPQCPPGYSKVITINPIRWKMAEAYYITGVESVEEDVATKFRNYFVPQTNPFMATFKLGETDGSVGMHTHQLSEGGALTFQTNTWLNTTISGYTNNSGVFMGWHAIMGFLYYGDQYSEYLQGVGASGYSGKVIWNLFPVYNEEMSAIANVYCYFERDNTTSYPRWTWERNYIGTYDQLNSFRSGYEKDSGYTNRLNDPTLGYTEAW